MMETDDLFYENSNGSMKMNGHGKNVSRADSSTLNQEVAAQAVPDAGDEADVIDLFDESPEKIERNDFSENSEISREGKGAKPDIAEIAKKRLSKWAARLFDPDRRRGLIETPEIIPLNDEFLSAFGKRTKKDVEELGQNIVIDNSNLDEAEPDVDVMEEPTAKKARKEKVGVKVSVKSGSDSANSPI